MKNKTKQTQEIKKTNNFFNWFKKAGGDMKDLNIDNVHSKFNEPVFLVSTFKTNPEETKNKHNHKFTFNL